MPGRANYLTASDRIGAAVALVIEHQVSPIVGFDCPLKVHAESAIRSASRMIGAAKPTGDAALGAPLSKEEYFLFVARDRGP